MLAALEQRAADAAVPPELAAHVRGLCRSYRAWLATMDRLAAPRA